MKKKQVVIIGAGPAGLSAAYELLEKSSKYEVVVLEATKDIGGISKTVQYKGNRMDIGGHRFFSKEKRVNDFWDMVMPVQGKPSYDDKKLHREKSLVKGGPDPEKVDVVRLKRNRISRIYYLKKFFDYPVSMKKDTFKNMGLKNTIACGFSYLKSIFIKKKEDSLENFYINRFGKKLYGMFFEKYTEKLWGRHPRDISAEWGSQRVKGLSIIAVLKNALKINKKKETSLIEEYTYPKYGPGNLWEEVASKVKKMGGKILFEHEVRNVNLGKDNKVKSLTCLNGNKKVEINGDYFISSMPLKDLTAGIKGDVPKKVKKIAEGLPYRDFVTIGLLLKKLNLKNETNIKTLGNIVPDCWIYVQEANVQMGRIQIFNNWSPYMVKDPDNTVWVGLEYFCNEGDAFWKLSEDKLKELAVSELIQMGIISKDDVLDYHVEKVKKAYPAYFDTYKDIDTLRAYLDKIDNLYCVGRNGQHRYNNMDHSMMSGFLAADHIIDDNNDKTEIWNVNTEQEYHEEEKAKPKEKKLNGTKIINSIIFLAFLAFTLFLSFKHELWRDEAQNWLLNRDLSLGGLIAQLKVEGHPILWYLILRPFVRLGGAYTFSKIIPWIISLIMAYIVLKKMPYNSLVKFLVLFSTPFVYIAPVFVRSYCLVLLLIVLLASLYKKRFEHPILYGLTLIALLNTHIIICGLPLALIGIDFIEIFAKPKERKSAIKIMIIGIIGLILLVLQLYGSTSSSSVISNINSIFPAAHIININITRNSFFATVFAILIFAYLFYLIIKREFGMALVLVCSYCAIALIIGINLNYYLCLMVLPCIVFSFWNLRQNTLISTILIALLFGCQIGAVFLYLKSDITENYSSAYETSIYIKENIPSGSEISCQYIAHCSSLMPYFNKGEYKFIDVINDEEYTYVDWWKYYVVNRENAGYKPHTEYAIIFTTDELVNYEGYDVVYISTQAMQETYVILKQIKNA
jgi:protoporphyrinogen oxidase